MTARTNILLFINYKSIAKANTLTLVHTISISINSKCKILFRKIKFKATLLVQKTVEIKCNKKFRYHFA